MVIDQTLFKKTRITHRNLPLCGKVIHEIKFAHLLCWLIKLSKKSLPLYSPTFYRLHSQMHHCKTTNFWYAWFLVLNIWSNKDLKERNSTYRLPGCFWRRVLFDMHLTVHNEVPVFLKRWSNCSLYPEWPLLAK